MRLGLYKTAGGKGEQKAKSMSVQGIRFCLWQQAKGVVTAALGDTLALTHAGLHTRALTRTLTPTAQAGCSQRPALLHTGPC